MAKCRTHPHLLIVAVLLSAMAGCVAPPAGHHDATAEARAEPQVIPGGGDPSFTLFNQCLRCIQPLTQDVLAVAGKVAICRKSTDEQLSQLVKACPR
jgi:hypothetical protein